MPANTYTPSVNIIRDANRELVYYPTPNAVQVVNQISDDFKSGRRAFNIVGAYGTGKSSLLWAMEQSIRAVTETNRKRFFDINLIADAAVEVVNFIGEYASIIDTFADRFGSDRRVTGTPERDHTDPKEILHEVFNRYHDIGKANPSAQPLLILVVDEFGKFLEYAVAHEPEREFYFVQQLAEFVNNTDYNICLLTTVHQNTDAYASSLTDAQRKEWTKVKGRLREINFNEPVEQLLFLVGEHTTHRHGPVDAPTKARIKTALKLAQQSKALTLAKSLAPDIANRLFPLDLLSAATLTVALQRYGQNERSLFSFLESTDHTGLSRVRLSDANPFYNVANVFDYLTFNFYSYLNSKDNKDYAAWMGIRNTLEKVEGQFGEEAAPYEKLVKTVGLLGLLIPYTATLDKTFLIRYAQTCLGLADAEERIGELEQWNIMRYRGYRGRYLLNEGTDLDVQVELSRAGNDVDQIRDVTTLLQRYYQLPPVLAKRHSYQTGTPRLFDYWISDGPTTRVPEGETDGFINLIFSETLTLDALREHAATQPEAIVYAYYQHTDQIRDGLYNIEKTQKVIERHEEDKIAVRELNQILEHHKNLLNHMILDGLFMPGHVTWVFQEEVRTIGSPHELNQWLSEVCETVFEDAPVFKNELVNRHKLSGSIGFAKRNFLQALVGKWGEPNLGFDDDRFPPEKTIYLTLLAQNGLVDTWEQTRSGVVDDEMPSYPAVSETSSFWPLWNACETFLNSAKQSRRTVAELITILSTQPFKLKQGLIEFWVPTFLFIKRDDFALFEEDNTLPTARYVPDLSADILELVIKEPKKYALKAFGVDGLRLNLFNSYRHLFQLNTELSFGNGSFIETIKPLLTFHRGLPDYAKTTKRLSREALAVRLAIEKSVEPEKTFFEELPMALGYSADALQTTPDLLEPFVMRLQDAIKEIRTAYDGLLGRFESFLLTDYVGDDADFDDYKARLQDRFTNLRDDLLTPAQKTFVGWLNSMAQAVVGKPLTALRDADEAQLYDRFRRLMRELDNLTNLTDLAIDTEREDVFSLKIGSLVDGISEDLVRMPKSKQMEADRVAVLLRKQLGIDSIVNIAALTNAFKNRSENDQGQTRTRHIGRQRQCRVGHLYAAAVSRTRHRILHLRYGQGTGRNLPTHPQP